MRNECIGNYYYIKNRHIQYFVYIVVFLEEILEGQQIYFSEFLEAGLPTNLGQYKYRKFKTTYILVFG